MRILFLLALAGTVAGALPTSSLRPTSDAHTTAVSDRPDTPADTVREYRGFYETGFERSWFEPCDAARDDDIWWVTLTDAALRQRDSLARATPPHRAEGTGATRDTRARRDTSETGATDVMVAMGKVGRIGVMSGMGVFVRWRGTISDRMPAGHMGRGTRYMLVSEVLEVGTGSGAGCATT